MLQTQELKSELLTQKFRALSHAAAVAAAAAKSLQSCPTLCDPIDGSPPGSPVPGILQARTLEWFAISFSNASKWKVKVKSLVMSDPQWPHGLQPSRLLRPWDFPGKSTTLALSLSWFSLSMQKSNEEMWSENYQSTNHFKGSTELPLFQPSPAYPFKSLKQNRTRQ